MDRCTFHTYLRHNLSTRKLFVKEKVISRPLKSSLTNERSAKLTLFVMCSALTVLMNKVSCNVLNTEQVFGVIVLC